MAARRTLSRIIASALALTLLFGTVPALAVDEVPAVVGYHVTVGTTDLYGTALTDLPAAIAAACPTPTLAPLAATAVGTTFTLEVTSAVRLDLAGMTTRVIAATEDTVVAPAWSADLSVVTAFVARIVKAVDKKPVDAQRVVKKRRLKVTAPVNGRAVDKPAAIAAVRAAIGAELAADGAEQPAVVIPIKTLTAKGPLSLGKTIVVVLSERRVYLYKNSKLEKKYRCAIGMRAYPTPRGKFKVIGKKKNPTWRNPYSAWSKSMPAFIKGGYYNPLGLRALYINSSGIRIHGTSKTYSMGQAASHGCIRLTNKNVVDIYPRVPVGTPVYIVK